MAYNEALTNLVRKALEGIPKVTEKRMFRGITFMVNGKMCISAGDNELMIRISPEVHEQIAEVPGVRPMVMKGKELKGYVYVHEDVLKSKRELDRWVRLALDCNKEVKAPKKKR